MANKKLWLGILVTVLVSGMTLVGCDDGSTNNPFEGTSWTMRDDGSIINFYSSTWEWFENLMPDVNDALTLYDFKGNYTYSGNIATIISTHWRTTGGNWVSWSGKWTVTLTGNEITVVYYGEVNSRMLLKQISENRGYRSIK